MLHYHYLVGIDLLIPLSSSLFSTIHYLYKINPIFRLLRTYVRANNIEYKLEKWQSPDGKQIQVAEMADHLKNTHFGADLKAYIIHWF